MFFANDVFETRVQQIFGPSRDVPFLQILDATLYRAAAASRQSPGRSTEKFQTFPISRIFNTLMQQDSAQGH